MGRSSKHKETTRQEILVAARRLFAAKGYAATSIEEIMRECSLTRGGFYAHFASKSGLYREALSNGVSVEERLDEYLGSRFAFLAADVASREPEVRAAYASAFKSISENSSLPAATMIVGALAVAQTIDDPVLKSRLLASCRENLDALLGNVLPVYFWEPAAG